MNNMGWTEPTPVQIESIPVGLQGRDMFAQAQTGTGKTGAYGSIILGRIKPEMKFTSALVIVPTRELANQVSEELSKLAEFTGHTCIPIYGGSGHRAPGGEAQEKRGHSGGHAGGPGTPYQEGPGLIEGFDRGLG